MAIDTLDTSDRLSGGGLIANSATGESQNVSFGGLILPAMRVLYTFGTEDAQVDKWHLARRTLAGTTFDNLNLTSGLTCFGVTQVFTKLKRVVVAIIDPDGTKKLRIGPQGQTNANQLWFQAVTANFWEETYNVVVKDRPVTGWTVTAATTDVLSIYNPGGSSLEYAIWLLGN